MGVNPNMSGKEKNCPGGFLSNHEKMLEGKGEKCHSVSDLGVFSTHVDCWNVREGEGVLEKECTCLLSVNSSLYFS